tara:strand:- start:25 stop:141 length:117 start_codon:yes stop_codon:yes gene_type:complete
MEELEECECASCNERFYVDETSSPDICPKCEGETNAPI